MFSVKHYWRTVHNPPQLTWEGEMKPAYHCSKSVHRVVDESQQVICEGSKENCERIVAALNRMYPAGFPDAIKEAQ